jgi:TRAP-type C4-dicarboxylate transport system substrate-binding protein
MTATSASAIELKMGHYAPESHPANKAAMMMAEAVAKRTNGAVTIKIFPANKLGDGNEVLEQQIQGAIVTKINFKELPMTLKQGVVDGQENPLSVIYHYKLFEDQPHLALTYHVYNSMMAVASKKTWAKLSVDQQKILTEEARKAGQWFRDEQQKEERSLIAKLQATGMKITLPDRGAFKASMKLAYDKISEYAGKQNVDKFLKMVEATP